VTKGEASGEDERDAAVGRVRFYFVEEEGDEWTVPLWNFDDFRLEF